MSKYIKEFCRRGLMWGAWGGPMILAIVWLCLQKSGTISFLTVNEAVLGIITTAVMGFIAAGITVVYQIESLPRASAGLIQFAVLFVDYLGIYLLNGWIPTGKVWIFSIIFVVGFCLIWFSIYLSIKIKVDRMNRFLTKN